MVAAWLAEADIFVCADGAGRPYEALPRPPDLVIGDFDTLGAPPVGTMPGTRFLKIDEQESTDSEKALDWIAGEGFAEVAVLGALGGRLDHALFNAALLERYAHRLRLALVEPDAISVRAGAGEHRWDLPAGTLFSLLPLAGPAEGVTLSGAVYPLAGARLSPGEGPTAISNRVAQPPLALRLTGGSLLLRAGAVPAGARTAPDRAGPPA
jgi:thiamine pyrophosphokinase